MEVDLLHALDLAGLDETAELGDGLPLLLVVLAAATAPTTATTTATATVTTTIATSSKATAARRTSSPISHFCDCRWLLNGKCCRRGTRSSLGRFGVRRGRFAGGGAFCWEILVRQAPTLKVLWGLRFQAASRCPVPSAGFRGSGAGVGSTTPFRAWRAWLADTPRSRRGEGQHFPETACRRLWIVYNAGSLGDATG